MAPGGSASGSSHLLSGDQNINRKPRVNGCFPIRGSLLACAPRLQPHFSDGLSRKPSPGEPLKEVVLRPLETLEFMTIAMAKSPFPQLSEFLPPSDLPSCHYAPCSAFLDFFQFFSHKLFFLALSLRTCCCFVFVFFLIGIFPQNQPHICSTQCKFKMQTFIFKTC